jgi:hypothetical protein
MDDAQNVDFFHELTIFVNALERDLLNLTADCIEYALDRLHCAVCYIETVQTEHAPTSETGIHIYTLLSALADIKCKLHELQSQAGVSSVGRLSQAGQHIFRQGPGRPCFKIDTEILTYLLDQGFKYQDIAKMYGVSRITIWRRMKDVGLVGQRYSTITDYSLDAIIQEINQEHPHSGVAMVMGHLVSRRLFVQRHRVRASLKRCDPLSSSMRWGLTARRRVYSVEGPNSLWHIDGHHALIRWRLVTHGAIDGYSRLITYLQVSNNNKSDTVKELFLRAVEEYGVPSRVRADFGCENYGVQNVMEDVRGEGRGSFIGGRSVHNTRIERLWRDVYYGVIQTYYALFYFLEGENKLDIDNEADLFALHYVYIPRINKSLVEFKNAYNHHPLRTERNWTPWQIWTNGMLNEANTNQSGVQTVIEGHSLPHDFTTYGIDPLERQVTPNHEAEIVVADIQLQLPHGLLCSLEDVARVHARDNDFGIAFYYAARDIIHENLSIVN